MAELREQIITHLETLTDLFHEACHRDDKNAIECVDMICSWKISKRIIFEEFGNSCKEGRLDVAKRLVGLFDVTKHKYASRIPCIFAKSCTNGHLNVAKWMVDVFKLKRGDIIDEVYEVLSNICENGHLDVAKWLHKTFRMTSGMARRHIKYAFGIACASDQLDAAKWLHKTFKITNEEAKGDNYDIFRETDDLCMMRWLHETFGCSMDDVRYCFHNVTNSIETMQWLRETFALSDDDARVNNNEIFRDACNRGYLDIAQWLHANFDLKLRKEDIAELLQSSDVQECSETMQWLRETF